MKKVSLVLVLGLFLAALAGWWILRLQPERQPSAPAVPATAPAAAVAPAAETPVAPPPAPAATGAAAPPDAAAGETAPSAERPTVAGDAPPLSITGRVIDEEGLPVEGATVLEVVMFRHPGAAELPATTSGADGGFVLAVQGTMNHSLTARHESLGLAARKIVEAAGGSSGVEIVMVDVAAVSGQVVDESGDPVAGALVRVSSSGMMGFHSRDGKVEEVPGDLHADAVGRFSTTVEPSEHVMLRAVADGYLESELVWFPIAPGEQREGVVLTLPAVSRLRGRTVHAGDGSAVAGATVSAAELETGRGISGSSLQATSDEQGGFEIARSSRRKAYHVSATAPGLVSIDDDRAIAGDASGVVVAMVAAASISGRVLDQQGEPVASARLQYGRPGTAELFLFQRMVMSQSDGSYRIDGLNAGEHLINCSRMSGDSIEIPVTLAEGELREGLDIVLPDAGQITGTVLDEEGNPVPGGRISFRRARRGMSVEIDSSGAFAITDLLGPGEITLSPPDGWIQVEPAAREIQASPGDVVRFVIGRGGILAGRVSDESGAPVRRVHLELVMSSGNRGASRDHESDDGAFELAGLTEGVGTLTISASGYAELSVRSVHVPGRGREDLGELVLPAGSILQGRVVDGAGAPVELAQVRALLVDADRLYGRAHETGMVRTDAAGAFTLANLVDGDHLILAEHPDHSPAWRRVTLPSSAALVLELGDGGAIAGSVRTGDEPVPGAEVTASVRAATADERAQGDRRIQTSTGADGEFRIDHLVPGTYSVSVNMPGRRYGRTGSVYDTWLSARVTVSEGATARCDLRLGGCRLMGKVLGLRPPRDDDREHRLSLLGNGLNMATPIASDGAFEFEGVPPGHYDLSISGVGIRPVEVPDAPEHEVVIQAPGGWIEGVVLDGEGKPVEQASVQARARERGPGDDRTGYTRGDGTFEIDGVEAGAVTVTAQKRGAGVSAPVELEVPVTGAVRAELRLLTGCTLLVSVRDPSGRPVLDPEIAAVDQHGTELHSSTLSPAVHGDGRFEITMLPAGTYRIAAGATGLGTAWVDGVTIGSESAVTVTTVELGPDRGRFRLQLRRAGRPAASMRFALEDGGGLRVRELDSSRQYFRLSTDEDGAYESRLLPAGSYRIRIEPAPGAILTRELEIPAGGGLATLEIDF